MAILTFSKAPHICCGGSLKVWLKRRSLSRFGHRKRLSNNNYASNSISFVSSAISSHLSEVQMSYCKFSSWNGFLLSTFWCLPKTTDHQPPPKGSAEPPLTLLALGGRSAARTRTPCVTFRWKESCGEGILLLDGGFLFDWCLFFFGFWFICLFGFLVCCFCVFFGGEGGR